MQERSDAVVFIGCGYPIGGVLFMAHMGCAIYKAAQGCDFDFYFASVSAEGQKDYWSLVQCQISESAIIKADTFSELAQRVVMLSRKYHRMIVHTGGGYGQTKHFIRARKGLCKKLAERIVFIGTTHSYRNDSFLRIPMSAFQYILYRLYYRRIVFQCRYAADRFVGGNDLVRRGMGVFVPLGCEPFDKISDKTPLGIAENTMLSRILNDKLLFKFVYLAALRPGKMHVWLVHALAPVLRRHKDVKVLLCGDGAECVKSTIKKAILDEKIQEQIILTGQIERSEIPWLLKHVNCALVPSRAETFGHNFLEPMFARVPVIGTSVGIGREIITDGKTGYHISLRDVSGFRQIINSAIIHRDRLVIMGKSAYELVRNRFSHEAVSKQIISIYEQLLKA